MEGGYEKSGEKGAVDADRGYYREEDGNGREILVLLESGSVVFDGDGTYDAKKGVFRTDYIWKVGLPDGE